MTPKSWSAHAFLLLYVIAPPSRLFLVATFLVSQLQGAEIVTTRGEDGTAIGDAISLAVDKLNNLDNRQTDEIKSKVVILLKARMPAFLRCYKMPNSNGPKPAILLRIIAASLAV